jgi:hypothetical protein
VVSDEGAEQMGVVVCPALVNPFLHGMRIYGPQESVFNDELNPPQSNVWWKGKLSVDIEKHAYNIMALD